MSSIKHHRLEERIRAFKYKAICPSDMWLSLFEELAPDEVLDFLSGLPKDLQQVLREEYEGLARYRFEPPCEFECFEVKQMMKRWFEDESGFSAGTLG